MHEWRYKSEKKGYTDTIIKKFSRGRVRERRDAKEDAKVTTGFVGKRRIASKKILVSNSKCVLHFYCILKVLNLRTPFNNATMQGALTYSRVILRT